MVNLKHKRYLLKISGESIGDKHNNHLYDHVKMKNIAQQVIELVKNGLQIALVLGGGNIWRGKQAHALNMDKINADYMGMMATIMNSLALESIIKKLGYDKVIVCSALEINKIMEPYYHKKVNKRLNDGYIVILAAGTGLPYFTTDSAATLRAIELKIDVILMAKNGVDGIYTADPKKDEAAKHISELALSDLISLRLNVMDQTASTLALEEKINIIVFDINKPNNIINAVNGVAKVTKINPN